MNDTRDATSVLIVEDDRNIVDLLQANLLVRGFEVVVSRTGAEVLERIKHDPVDVVLLDLMLPGSTASTSAATSGGLGGRHHRRVRAPRRAGQGPR
jgi:CheY-like chemotaxis protein